MGANEMPQHESGSEPEEGKAQPHVEQISDDGHGLPLFLRDNSEGRKGNAQDEKDEMGE
ncbi:MAG: hypothetical protein QOJ70_1191 [Acidobacteriota bacterium]|jgi:hypothetical protein|nr:hypothetical protein [Acidobacteriota bacterium]